MEFEIWKSVKGYEGIYEVSNLGNVRSLDREVNSFINETRKIKGIPLKPKQDKDGYLNVCLMTQCKRKHYRVHRLVAMAFIDNPDNLPSINHKDENKSNNQVSNLEWCSYSYNVNYGNRNSVVSKKLKVKKSKAVHQFNKDGKVINEFTSAKEAHEKTSVDLSNISACCLGKRKTAGGFVWRYKNDI